MLFEKFIKTFCICACFLTLTGCAGLGDVLVGVVQAAAETSAYMEKTNPQRPTAVCTPAPAYGTGAMSCR